jgi:hypothetical protein
MEQKFEISPRRRIWKYPGNGYVSDQYLRKSFWVCTYTKEFYKLTIRAGHIEEYFKKVYKWFKVQHLG